MELREYFALLRKWLWLIVICTVIAGVTAYVVSRQQTPIYQATATVLISQDRSTTSGSDYADILSSERIARTYAQLLQDWPVLQRTISQLGFEADYQTVAGDFDVSIAVNSVRDTQLVNLRVEANDPQIAARLANTLPDVFMEMNQERQRQRYADTRSDLQSELAKVEADLTSTQQAIETLRSSEAPGVETEIAKLDSALKRYEASYVTLINSLEGLRLTEAQTTDNIVLTTPALVAKGPIRPRVLLNTLLAAIVGALLGLGAAFLVEYLDDTIKTPDDIRRHTDLPTLGAIIAMGGEAIHKRLTPLYAPKSPAAEAYRVLRTNLQFSALDNPLQTVLVTSPGPSEGKSTTAANLALVMAQTGKRVVLLDADLRRPNVHRLFQLPNNIGLTTAVLRSGDDADFSDCLQETDLPGLQVMTTGPLPPNPAELLGSTRMRELVGRLCSQADLIVVDSPPVLAVADAAILSNQVDGTLLVVSAGETRTDPLLRAIERLKSVSVTPLGVVLNKLTARENEYYYYYHYANLYGAGEDDQTTKSRNGRFRRLRRSAGQVSEQSV